MAVVINNFDVTAQSEAPAERGGAGSGAGGGGGTLDPDDFISRYGMLLREFIRDEVERHLRNVAD